MKEQGDSLRDILEEQKQLIAKYETALLAYEKDDVIVENKKLKEKLGELAKQQETLSKEYEKVKKEADGLRWALREQIISERMKLIERNEELQDTYFKKECNMAANELQVIKQKLNVKINELSKMARSGLKEEAEEYMARIGKLQKEIEESLIAQQRQMEREKGRMFCQIEDAYEELKNHPVSEEVMAQRVKANNMEAKIGQSWINKAGIFLILIGIVTVMRYSFENYFSPLLKGIFGLILGVLFLAGGEYFARKDKKIFSQGMIGGGIGILYITVFCSYFILNITSMPVALLMAILISAASFVLSLRYDSRTIGCFALIGGYMPLAACALIDEGLTGNLVYASMGYVMLLNSVTLLVGNRKNWPVMQYLSFFTNIPVSIALAYLSDSQIMGIIYSFIIFLSYMAVMLMPVIRQGIKTTGIKAAVMGVNTFVSCVVIWGLFLRAGLNDWMGLLALGFCGCYYALSRLLDKLDHKEKQLQVIFNITAMTFAVLVIPMQVDSAYISLGWFIEAVLLIGYGLKMSNRKLEMAGRVIFALCVTAFYINKWEMLSIGAVFYYVNYTLMIAGLLGVLALYLYKYRQDIAEKTYRNRLLTAYKYFALFNLWLYLIRAGNDLIEESSWLSGSILPVSVLLFSIVTALVLMLMQKVKWLYDRRIRYVTSIGFVMVDIVCILQNCQGYLMTDLEAGPKWSLVSIVILILWNVLILWNLGNVIRCVVVQRSWNFEMYPLFLALAVISDMTIIICRQFNLGLSSIVISIFYIVSAFIMICCGFMRGYRWVRYWGLGLCLLALGKLFLFDFTIGVTVGYKIISYFCFGIILLVISYLYQRFSKKLEGQMSIMREEEKHEN